MIHKTAAKVSDLSHKQSRAWKLAKNGEEIDVFLDTIPDDEYEERRRRLDALGKTLDKALRGRAATGTRH